MYNSEIPWSTNDIYTLSRKSTGLRIEDAIKSQKETDRENNLIYECPSFPSFTRVDYLIFVMYTSMVT